MSFEVRGRNVLDVKCDTCGVVEYDQRPDCRTRALVNGKMVAVKGPSGDYESHICLDCVAAGHTPESLSGPNVVVQNVVIPVSEEHVEFDADAAAKMIAAQSMTNDNVTLPEPLAKQPDPNEPLEGELIDENGEPMATKHFGPNVKVSMTGDCGVKRDNMIDLINDLGMRFHKSAKTADVIIVGELRHRNNTKNLQAARDAGIPTIDAKDAWQMFRDYGENEVGPQQWHEAKDNVPDAIWEEYTCEVVRNDQVVPRLEATKGLGLRKEVALALKGADDAFDF